MTNKRDGTMMNWSDQASGAITVTVQDQRALLQSLETCLVAGKGFSVATLNLDHVVKLSQSAAFREAYAAQTHVTADGNPIVWLSRLAGQRVDLVPGSELIAPLAMLAARLRLPVALFGATQTTLEAAAAALVARYPGLDVVLCRGPAMGFDPQSAGAGDDIAVLRASGARLIFLALGAPKQEEFAARAQADMPGVGFVSIGAGLDFIAGTQRRAPAWVRAIAAEWLWRLFSDPQRLAARYGACLVMLPQLLRRALKTRRQGSSLS